MLSFPARTHTESLAGLSGDFGPRRHNITRSPLGGNGAGIVGRDCDSIGVLKDWYRHDSSLVLFHGENIFDRSIAQIIFLRKSLLKGSVEIRALFLPRSQHQVALAVMCVKREGFWWRVIFSFRCHTVIWVPVHTEGGMRLLKHIDLAFRWKLLRRCEFWHKIGGSGSVLFGMTPQSIFIGLYFVLRRWKYTFLLKMDLFLWRGVPKIASCILVGHGRIGDFFNMCDLRNLLSALRGTESLINLVNFMFALVSFFKIERNEVILEQFYDTWNMPGEWAHL